VTTTPSQYPIPPITPVVTDAERAEARDSSDRELVGESDAAADAVRAGADVDLDRVTRDSDGTPVGRHDLRADIERSGVALAPVKAVRSVRGSVSTGCRDASVGFRG
jgi:hypothetical protein